MNITEIQHHLQEAKSELDCLLKGKKASASRCRANLQKIKLACDITRKEVLNYSKGLPVKQRKVVEDLKEMPPIPIQDIEDMAVNVNKKLFVDVDTTTESITPKVQFEEKPVEKPVEKIEEKPVEKKIRKPRVSTKKSIK
jgi:hypothetical protein